MTTDSMIHDLAPGALTPEAQGYRMCSRCVMDTSDRDIVFDEDGVCNHCHMFAKQARRRLSPSDESGRRFADVVAEMKAAGVGRPYDCILGVSGGADSTY